MKALVVLSGGQDSTTCLGWAKNRYDEVETVTFLYGQKHAQEVDQAKTIASKFNVKNHLIEIEAFKYIADSALVTNGDVNKKRPGTDLPASFVPNRNMLFLTIAHALAQKIDARDLVTGVCQTDYSGYPDCRNEFIKMLEYTLNMSSEANVGIKTPLMYLNKAQTFQMAEKEGCLDIVLSHSITCYNGNLTHHSWGWGCGDCPACELRVKGWEEYNRDYL